jgi:hypothetical protein
LKHIATSANKPQLRAVIQKKGKEVHAIYNEATIKTWKNTGEVVRND